MTRLLSFASAASLCWALRFTEPAHASPKVVDQIDRSSIIKEPAYKFTPKYSLMALRKQGDVKVWMVEDGRRLFIDKNANGDLTDDGPPLEPSGIRSLGANRWDFKYLLQALTPSDGSRHTDFVMRRWKYDDEEDCYGLSLSVDGQMPMYAGWFGTFWSTTRLDAPIIHFGGPFTPKLLRRKEFTIGETQDRLSLCFLNPGSAGGAVSRLSIDALPGSAVPKLHIEWPVAAGAAPLRTSYELTDRCCYWEFYTLKFQMPRGVVPGTAKVTVDFTNGPMPIELTTAEMVVPVVVETKKSDSARQ